MICFKCGKPAIELHHTLFGNRRGKRASKQTKEFVNVEYNLMPICRVCHINHGGRSNREAWMKHLIREFGRDVIIQWLESAPDNMKRGDLWKANRRLVDFSNVGQSWQPSKTGGKE